MGVVGKWFSFGKNENFDEGIRLYQAAEYLPAIGQFKICLSSEPDPSTRERARSYMAGAYGKLAKDEVAKQDWSLALDYLDEAVALRPAFADLRMVRAQVFDALRRQEDRKFEIRFSLDLNPRYGLAVLHDGIYKIEHGEKDAGLARVRESAGCDPTLDSEEYRSALALLEGGKIAEGVASLKRVAPVPKTKPDEVVRAADQYAHEERWTEAEEAYRRALEIVPGYADVRCRHGQVLLQLDEVEQAIAEFREAVTINPRYADAYAMLGIAYRRQGEETEAVEAFRAALAADPAHIIAAMEIGRGTH